MLAEAGATEVKFLLVDDLEENLFALEALLQRDGLRLYKARSGSEALELLLVHDFALALLDVQMDGMDGFELAELMRGTERTRRVPIIFLTAVATDERRHFRGYETGAVDFLFKPLNPQMLTSKAGVFFELARQRQELARQRDDLRIGAERLARALGQIEAHADNSPLAVLGFDREFRITEWSRGAERMLGWERAEAMGRQAEELGWIEEAGLDGFRTYQTQLREGGGAVSSLRLARRDGRGIDSEWYSSVLRDSAGGLASVHVQILDVTERKRAEATQRLLLGELNHRVKNTLATVQAMAMQTLRYSPEPAAFAADFSGRIQALARSHSLLSHATWQGAMLRELIDQQLQLGTIDDARLEVSGPDVQLPPQTALHLGLILHELTTNANKYGALSNDRGRLSLAWELRGGVLELRWVERGGPAVVPPARTGFGTTLIERGAGSEGGEARVTYGVEGVTWLVSFPLDGEPATPSSSPRPPATSGSDRIAGDLSGRRFLIVEDEPIIALHMAKALEQAGAQSVSTASTKAQALEIIGSGSVDSALLDGNLRGVPVDDIAAALVERDIPFVFVSGYGRENLPEAFSSAPLLSKPFSYGELIKVASHLVAKPVRADGAERDVLPEPCRE